ncbi:MAG: 50S ribosomal protein L25 [Patescibacteria group bacterium]|nr:50S ribosomal protein L25 [Patescibacteria group bacterium]
MELTATKRLTSGKSAQKLREEGRMPGVMYGPKQAAVAIEMSLKEFTKTLEQAGESTIVELVVDGEGHTVLIHDIDRDPVTDTPRHADFYAIVKGQKVQVAVPIEFTGIAPAVKELSANLIKSLHEIEVEAEATNLPHEIEVDVSGLDQLDKQILAGDLQLPPGVILITGPEEVVATVIAAVEEKEEEVAAAPDMSAIEISEERGKGEEEPGTPEEGSEKE